MSSTPRRRARSSTRSSLKKIGLDHVLHAGNAGLVGLFEVIAARGERAACFFEQRVEGDSKRALRVHSQSQLARARELWVHVPKRESDAVRGAVLDYPEEIGVLVAVEDRLADVPVFAGVTDDQLRRAMASACKLAGVPSFSPHDLRHRRITLWHYAGVPLRDIQERVGHSWASTTLDTYTHVMPVDELEPAALLAVLDPRGEVWVRS